MIYKNVRQAVVSAGTAREDPLVSSERADCWFGVVLMIYEKQRLRWHRRGNLILFAVRETQLTSQQKAVFFRAQREGKFGPHVDAERARRSWQSLEISRSRWLIRFLCLFHANQ